jgi:hypothetical protein
MIVWNVRCQTWNVDQQRYLDVEKEMMEEIKMIQFRKQFKNMYHNNSP